MRFLLLIIIIISFFIQPTFCFDEMDYYDSTATLTIGLNDTLKAMAVFSWARDGIQNDTMKLMYPWTQSIWDLADSGSIPNYYLQNSFNKHMLIGVSLPQRDTMFISNVDICLSDTQCLGSYYSYRDEYFQDIMAQADSLYDFRDFDITGPYGVPDGKVDLLIFAVCNITTGGVNIIGHSYTSEESVSIGDGVTCFIFNKDYQLGPDFIDGGRPRSQRTFMHEYNHLLGTPDTEHGTYKSHHFGLGGFGTEVYFGTQFNGVLAPLNPYWRKNKMHWINGKEIVHVPIYNKPIQYWSESDSSVLVLDSSGAPYLQSFYISAHNQTSSFDRFWPSPADNGGLLIYHFRKNVGWSQSDGRHKNIDVEIASGLYNWYVDSCSIYQICSSLEFDSTHSQCWPEDESLSIYADQPNPICGFDSLDWRLPCKNVWAGNNGEGSINSFFDGINYTEFDDFSNPSSKFCKSTYVDSQTVISHLAVRHIHPHNGKIYADLLVNNYYGQLANSTTWGHATIHKGYAITGDITVPAGETLRILAGTDIYFQTHEDNQPGPPSSTLCGIDVYGTLIAEGTSDAPIRFISSSSQYDSGAPGDWYGIRILSGGKASLNNVEIKYAYNALAAYTPESLGISNSTISWSENCGIYAEGTSLAATMIRHSASKARFRV